MNPQVPQELKFLVTPRNPGLPTTSGYRRTPLGAFANSTRGTGAKRTYLNITTQSRNVAYPPRPVPGSVADLDVIMDHCDFSNKKVLTSHIYTFSPEQLPLSMCEIV